MNLSPIKSEVNSQSFYSIDNSRVDFTVIEPPQQQLPPLPSSQLVNLYGLKQSSAIVQSSQQSHPNETMHSIGPSNQFQGMNMNQISGIGNSVLNHLERSDYLDKQIGCLLLPPSPTTEEIQQLERKIEGLKAQQYVLRKQVQEFQNLKQVRELQASLEKEGSTSMKKISERNIMIHSQPTFEWSDPEQISMKTLRTAFIGETLIQPAVRHFDIKPNKNSDPSEQRLKILYKSASFTGNIELLNDLQNEYKVQVFYQRESVVVQITNFSRGETNFAYAGRLNETSGGTNSSISEKLVFALKEYVPKKFTLSLSILLLIFEENKPKQEKNLLKIEEIRTVSVPLPLSCFAEKRFITSGAKSSITAKLQKKLHIYQINLGFGVDQDTCCKLKTFDWVREGWLSLKGSSALLRVELGELSRRGEEKGLSFRVGAKDKESQEAIDLIEYLCFMLAI